VHNESFTIREARGALTKCIGDIWELRHDDRVRSGAGSLGDYRLKPSDLGLDDRPHALSSVAQLVP
jgi:hypothetical protein